MPEKRFSNECCSPGEWTNAPKSCSCANPRIRTRWERGASGMAWAMSRYGRRTGLQSFGPHRKLADKLLKRIERRCETCDGSGLVDAPSSGGSRCVDCAACEGHGWLPRCDSLELAAMREQVLREFPNACGAVALKKPPARVLSPPDVPTWQRRSSAAPPLDPVVWDRMPLDMRRPVLQRARDEVVAAIMARDQRRATWCANQLLSLARSAHAASNVLDEGVLVTEDELDELAGGCDDEDDSDARHLPEGVGFPRE
jgi:hypothetical protein